jgi:hypothetical protein
MTKGDERRVTWLMVNALFGNYKTGGVLGRRIGLWLLKRQRSESSSQSTRYRMYVWTDTTLIAMYAFVVLSLPQCRSLPLPRDWLHPPRPLCCPALPPSPPLLPFFSSRAILDLRPLSLPHKRFCATLRPEVMCNASDHPHAEPKDWMQKPVTEVHSRLGHACDSPERRLGG